VYSVAPGSTYAYQDSLAYGVGSSTTGPNGSRPYQDCPAVYGTAWVVSYLNGLK
jgi:hypothetical protein